jgi:hypothetical protein
VIFELTELRFPLLVGFIDLVHQFNFR